MNENQFWLGFWAILCITLAVISGIGTSYWKDHNKKIVDLISSGTNPIAALCAMQDDYGHHPSCIILATKEK